MNSNANTSEAHERRGFFGRLSALGAWVVGVDMHPNRYRSIGAPVVESPCAKSPQTKGESTAASRSFNPANDGRFSDYPRPTVLPGRYRLRQTIISPIAGFAAGESEIAYLCNDPAGEGSPIPLTIFVCPATSRTFSGYHDGAPFEPLVLSTALGANSQAKYYDGMWAHDPNGEWKSSAGVRYRWARNYLHGLTFVYSKYSVGMYAPVALQGGPAKHDLIRVAEALRIPGVSA
jgi:hypothetical protein